MQERPGAVTFGGTPLTLVGPELQTGDLAPSFTVVGVDLRPVSLSDYAGKVVVISSLPSLDTPTCDLQTRRFNTEACCVGDDVVILTLSMDLPFAQARWCGAAGVDQVTTLSDHREGAFGVAYGVLIKELRLLTRAVFVVGKGGRLVHAQIVPEIKRTPDFDAAMAAVMAAV